MTIPAARSAETMEEAIDVTILMPCLDERITLPACIDTAQQAAVALAARGLSSEILISDNGSTDGSREYAESRGCRVTLCPQVSFLSPTRVSQDWSIGVSEAKIHRAAGMAVTYMPVVDGRRSSTYTFVHFLWHSGPRPNATPHETNPLKGE